MIKIKLAALCVIFSVLWASCQQANKPSKGDKEAIKIAEAEIQLANPKIKEAFLQYLKLKNELVASDAEGAKKAGEDLARGLKEIKGCESSAKLANAISKSSDLKEQRANFVLLNTEIIPLVKQSDIKSGVIYLQHCPMANNGEGAEWLAIEPDIKNPYYGDEMLTCGAVQGEFK
jgi:hypothetical protein